MSPTARGRSTSTRPGPRPVLQTRLLLGLLIAFIMATSFVPWWAAIALATGVAALYTATRTPLRLLLPPLPILVLLFAFQWWSHDLRDASRLLFSLLAAIGAATVFLARVRLEDMMAALDFLPEPALLAISMTLRLIPLQMQMIREVLDARKARGVGLSLTAIAIPVVIRSIRRAQALGDALVVRL